MCAPRLTADWTCPTAKASAWASWLKMWRPRAQTPGAIWSEGQTTSGVGMAKGRDQNAGLCPLGVSTVGSLPLNARPHQNAGRARGTTLRSTVNGMGTVAIQTQCCLQKRDDWETDEDESAPPQKKVLVEPVPWFGRACGSPAGAPTCASATVPRSLSETTILVPTG